MTTTPVSTTPAVRLPAAGAVLGLAAASLIGLGLLIAGFLPPPSPADDAAQTAARYLNDATRIRTGVALSAIGSFLLVGWYASVAVALRRIEGERRWLTFAWIIAGAGGLMDFILPLLFMETAAFRPGNADLVRGFNDLGWTCFLAAPYIFSFQASVLATAILQDRSSRPVFPRWFGYMNLWCALLYLPGVFVVFVKTGPLAWNGVLAWWIPLGAFGAWLITTAVLLMKMEDA